jgi:phage FluMu gp28-like protein
VLLEAVSDPSAKVIRKTCEDSFTFWKKPDRVKEFDKWLKHEVRDVLKSKTNPVYLGEDFARSGDLTCIFLDELFPAGELLTFCVIELRNVPFDQQWQTILYIMETLPNFAGGAFDSRGNGQMIAEYAAQEWPGYVHQVMISAGWYAENFPKLKGRMEDGTTNIPDDVFIREDFRVVGLKAGVPRVLERSGGPRERRHGDGAVAKLMVTFAALEDEDQGYHEYQYEPVSVENRFRDREDDIWD